MEIVRNYYYLLRTESFVIDVLRAGPNDDKNTK